MPLHQPHPALLLGYPGFRRIEEPGYPRTENLPLYHLQPLRFSFF